MLNNTEQKAAEDAALDLAALVERLGHHLRDKDFADDEHNVRMRFITGGPERHFIGQARPGLKTMEFMAQLIRAAIPALIDANLDARAAGSTDH